MGAGFRNVILTVLVRQREWGERARSARAVLSILGLARVPSEITYYFDISSYVVG